MSRGRARSHFACTDCGHQSPKWLGRCPDCGAWSTMEETVERPADVAARRASAAPARSRPLAEVEGERAQRLPSGLAELDRCLGGGIVEGSLILVGGEPGIGKSTLLLQVSDRLAARGATVLYVSGEESPAQVRMRGERLGLDGRSLQVLGETDLDAIGAEVERLSPDLLIVDSVQVVKDPAIGSAPGTVSQVRAAAERFLHVAKERGTATVLIGHVTKEGTLAGPRTLEHVVDTVLSFEAEAGHVHRLVRTVKNRFGPTGEVGVFEMRGDGLAEVADASRLFLSERRRDAPGSVVFPAMQGTRPVLVEVQALIAPTAAAQPRRMAVGVDAPRLSMLLAVLARSVALPHQLWSCDVFVNVAGGLRVKEPAADLAVLLAIASSAVGRPVAEDLAAFGEVGLAGEIRSVDRGAARLREVASIGLAQCVLPQGNVPPKAERPEGLSLQGASDLPALLGRLLDLGPAEPAGPTATARPEPARAR